MRRLGDDEKALDQVQGMRGSKGNLISESGPGIYPVG